MSKILRYVQSSKGRFWYGTDLMRSRGGRRRLHTVEGMCRPACYYWTQERWANVEASTERRTTVVSVRLNRFPRRAERLTNVNSATQNAHVSERWANLEACRERRTTVVSVRLNRFRRHTEQLTIVNSAIQSAHLSERLANVKGVTEPRCFYVVFLSYHRIALALLLLLLLLLLSNIHCCKAKRLGAMRGRA